MKDIFDPANPLGSPGFWAIWVFLALLCWFRVVNRSGLPPKPLAAMSTLLGTASMAYGMGAGEHEGKFVLPGIVACVVASFLQDPEQTPGGPPRPPERQG